MDIDGVFEEIGELGPYQCKVFVAICTMSCWSAFFMVHMVFIGAEPTYTCAGQTKATCAADGRPCVNTTFQDDFTSVVSEVFAALALMHIWAAFFMIHMVYVGAQPTFSCQDSSGVQYEGCRESGPVCAQPDYSKAEFSSISSEWNLVCSKAYKASLVQSIFMAGVLLGALVFGNLSDRSGRRNPLFICIAGLTFFGLLSSFAPSYILYCILRFIAGILCGGMILISFVLSTEVVGSKKRALCGMIIPGVFSLGIASFALTAFFIRQWRMLSVVSSLPGILWLLYFRLIPESPRWLLAQNRITDAENVLIHIAKQNLGSAYNKAVRLHPLELPPGNTNTYGLREILCHPNLRMLTFVQTYAWFVNSGVYYGLTMSSGNLGSNRYVSVTLSGLVEIPAYIASFFLLDRIGRRPTFGVSMVLGGISCLSILMAPADATLAVTVMALLGKLAISASFAVAYIYSAELYPTVIRNNAMGVCSMAARVGGIVAPMIIPLGSIYPNLQFIVFGGLAFTAGVLSLRLPETLNRPMPETLEDISKPRHLVEEAVSDVSEDKVKLLEESIYHKEHFQEPI